MDLEEHEMNRNILTDADFRIVEFEPFKYKVEQKLTEEQLSGSLWWEKKTNIEYWRIVGENGLTMGESSWLFVQQDKWKPAIFETKEEAISFICDIINKTNNYPKYHYLL